MFMIMNELCLEVGVMMKGENCLNVCLRKGEMESDDIVHVVFYILYMCAGRILNCAEKGIKNPRNYNLHLRVVPKNKKRTYNIYIYIFIYKCLTHKRRSAPKLLMAKVGCCCVYSEAFVKIISLSSSPFYQSALPV